MADFCMRHHPELCDVKGLCEPGEAEMILCESCGEHHLIDHEGYRVTWSEPQQDWMRNDHL